MQTIKIYDTTLRDGTQNKDVNFTVHDKLEIIKLLDETGVDYAELGWPGSNPKDMETFLKANKLKLNQLKISAFGSTRKKNIQAKDDPNLLAILESKAVACSLFGKTWLNHVTQQLKVTPEENLEAIEDSIRFLKKNNIEVFFDAEHYFDGFKDNPEYALKTLTTAINAGTDCLVLCETNGGCLPQEIIKIFEKTKQELKKQFPDKNIDLGIHCHNDSGCAVANSLVCAPELSQIQCTINGFGERTGNADLCQIVPALNLKLELKTKFNLKKLKELSEKIYILSNNTPLNNQPYVGKNAFSHKGGIHVDAISKGAIYEHINPESVGNRRQIVLSDLSGTANIVESLKEFNVDIDKSDPRVKDILKEVKELEKKGYDIGEIIAEKYLVINKHIPLNNKSEKDKSEKDKKENNRKTGINLTNWKVITENRNGKEYSECILVGTIDGKKREIIAPVDDNGPVDAIFNALRKMAETRYKNLGEIRLTNYKVMIAEDKGAESTVRVYIEFVNHAAEWANIGVSENILEASLEAVKKGFEYYLSRYC